MTTTNADHQPGQPADLALTEGLGLREWLHEREQNALVIAGTTHGAERAGWLEDAAYFRRAYTEATKVADMRMVLRMVDDNHRVDAGEKRKAWSGRFVVSEVRRVLEA